MVQTSHDPVTVVAFSIVVIFYLILIAYLARLLLARPTRHPVLFLGAVTTLVATLPVILSALSAAVA
jgi:tetrahydromethanopterin S-methyltransferase subunit E